MFILTFFAFNLRVMEADYYGKLDKVEENGSQSPRRDVNNEDTVPRKRIKWKRAVCWSHLVP
jgi:hypothetical protein